MPYMVHAKPPLSLINRWSYRFDYFPRKFSYKKDAQEAAREAKEKGGRDVKVEKVKYLMIPKY